jgi:hypothetical protein
MTTIIQDDNKAIKEYHRKRLEELSKPKDDLVFYVDGSISRNGKLIAEEATDEQKQWYKRRMSGPVWSWKRWYTPIHENKIGDYKNWQ